MEWKQCLECNNAGIVEGMGGACELSLQVNGAPVTLSGDVSYTIAGLLRQQEMRADRVAVERNGEIVARHLWDETLLEAGDRLEIVHFVGGGA